MLLGSAIFATVSPISGWLLYPFTLGLVATVNPCGFPLLPLYLGLFIRSDEQMQDRLSQRIVRSLLAGGCATLGFAVVFGSIGLLSQEGLRGAYALTASWARWLMVLLGGALLLIGLAALFGRKVHIRPPYVRPGLGLRRPLTLTLFGISYATASLGCSLPLFLGGVAGSFTRSGIARGMANFIAYSLGMGLLLTLLGLLVAIAGPAALIRIRAASRVVEPLGAIALSLVGAYLLLYWVQDLTDPAHSSVPVRFVESVQSHIAAWLQVNASLVGTALGLLIVAGLILAALLGGGTRPSPASKTPGRGGEEPVSLSVPNSNSQLHS